MSSRWTLFEFDAHWPEFWRAWSSRAVQDVLAPRVGEWMHRHFPNSTKKWVAGDPLWDLGVDDYWENHICDLAEEDMEDVYNSGYQLYTRTMRAQGLPCCTKDQFLDTHVMRAFEDACERNSPRKGTLESLVMPEGHNVLAPALAAAARAMFPRSIVITVEMYTHAVVMLPIERRVFDLIDYYFATRHLEPPSVMM